MKKYRDEGKVCYYCHKRIGPGCDWNQGRCPNEIKPEMPLIAKLGVVILIGILLMIGTFYG
jgi:hypothetical protein